MSERDPIRDLWTNQPSESFTMSVEEIRSRATKLQSVVQRRNFREFAVGAVLIVLFSWSTYAAGTLLGKLGSAMIAAGVAFVLWRLYVVARAATKDEMAVTGSWASFYRQELVRQRDALQSIWWWYLGPLIPGMALHWLAAALKAIESEASFWAWTTTVLGIAFSVVVFALVGFANKRAAQGLQAEIEALDAACKP